MDMELIGFIMNANEGSKIVKLAGEKGVNGGTIFLGEGTVREGLLRTLGFDNIKREIIILIAPTYQAKEAFYYISEKKELEKKNKGIGFRLPLSNVLGIRKREALNLKENKVESKMFQAIFVIVNKGEAEDVMKAAHDAGAQGGTIIQGRGAGEYEAKKVFNMDIEPEKEIVLIISQKEKSGLVINNISSELNIEEPNTGILFVTDLSETRGIY